MNKKEQSSFKELLTFSLVSLAIILPIRLFILQPFIVSGKSMYPTFETRDYLIVDEISYKTGREIQRGDIVIFKDPKNPSRFLIKRVIGLPGETVKIENNRITIINKEHPNGFILDEPYLENTSSFNLTKTIPEGQYFVLGDNRPASSDSRYWGPIPKELIIGRAALRLFPIAKADFNPGEYAFPQS